MVSNANIPGGPWPFSDNDRRRPLPPRDFTASAVAEGTLRVRWRDSGSPTGLEGAHPVVVQDWLVYVCDASLAGTPSGADPQFKFSVLAKAHSIVSLRSRQQGETLVSTVADPNFHDIYVTVAGISVDNVIGIPAEPVLCFGGATVLGPLNDVTAQTLNLTAVTDTYGGHFVDLNPSYAAPVELGRFFGVQLHLAGYHGASSTIEVGNILIYQRRPGGQQQGGHVYVPRDELQLPTTAYFVSVDRHGGRAADPTLSPSVSVPGGIYV